MSSTRIDDEEIIAVVRESESVEHSTTAVAEELPIGRGQTRRRLQRLADEDRVRRRRDGNNVVWWLPGHEAEIEVDAGDGKRAAGGKEKIKRADGGEDEAESADGGEGDETDGEESTAGEESEGDDAEAAEKAEEAAEDAGETASDAAEEVSDEVGETAEDVAEAVEETAEEVEEAVDEVAGTGPTAPGRARTAGDDDRMRQLALALGAVVLVLLLRRLLGGGEE
jgi:cobalamin biosynthesis protein CobT